MPRGKKSRKNAFIIDEADHSSSDEDDPECLDEGEMEYDLNDTFINDQASPSPPPDPLFNGQLEREVFINELQIEELPPATPPLRMPARGPPGSPPPPPPAGGGPPPPPPPPAKKPASDWIRPKSNKDKRMCQVVQYALMPAVTVGYLEFVLVTVIPDPREKLEDGWTAVPERRAALIEITKKLPGMFGFFIALETHGASADKKKKRKNPNAQEQAHQEEQQGADDDPKKKDILAGKAHFHILIYYPRLHTDVLNLSLCKQLVMEHLPNADVNEVKLPRNTKAQHSEPNFVRSCSYVLKGVNCPATKRYWQRHVNPAALPPIPAFYPGPHFGIEAGQNQLAKEESRRFTALLKQLPTYCEPHVPLQLAAAPETFSRPVQRTKSSEASYQLAQIMRKLGIFVGGREDDVFYMLDKQPGYEVQATYIQKYNLHELKRVLTTEPAAREIVHNYFEPMGRWFLCAEFQHVPEINYQWVELRDSYYQISTGEYAMKDLFPQFPYFCFRSYSYTRAEVESTLPVHWLRLLDLVCQPAIAGTIPDPCAADPHRKRVIYSKAIDKERLVIMLANLLRPRRPKQTIPFLWGRSNCGKSTLISFLQKLYPKEALGFLNKSCVSLSGIHESVAVIVADEFDVNSISRSDLLTLTDGSQLLTVRSMHQDARLIANPLCPMIFTNNFQPKYKDDDSAALENRFEMIHCENQLRPDHSEQEHIFREHLFIVAFLNRFLAQLEHAMEFALID